MDEVNHVSANFFTHKTIRSENFAKEFFDLLGQYGEALIPHEFDGGALSGHRWIPFDPTSTDLAVQAWMESGHALMRRQEPMESRITAGMHFAASGGLNTLSLSVEERYFEMPDHVAAFLDLCLMLYELLHPVYGLVHGVADKLETSTILDPKYGKTVIPTNLKRGLPGIYWANFLGPDYGAMLGRKQLLSAPGFRLQELPDGGMLILTSQSPLYPSSTENRRAQRELRQYLGEDIFYPSKAASTNVPQFNSEPAPLSADTSLLTGYDLEMAEKRAKAQNLIDHAKDLASLLVDESAKQGINLDQSPSSLRVLDQVLLQRREMGETLNQFSAKMYAAYTGEVARRALHGQWIVDNLTGEASVDIKGAKIFPLARVLKFWESEERDAFATILGILDVEAEP